MNASADSKIENLSIEQKALKINLSRKYYGTFAEIGAGQEVARYFFKVGGAAGSMAKTMSAYDMTFSDEIYGKVGRYVSRERLVNMLQHEYKLLLERLSSKSGAETCYFVFADTVAARNFHGTNECHGWLGVRFQAEPLAAPNDIIIHVRLTDKSNVLQQQALGAIGVNLLYGALFCREDLDLFVSGLIDDLSIQRLEVDMIEFNGPAFSGIDNRLMSLKLVHKGLTNAIMFAPDKSILQPSEILRKRPILVARGSFRPVTNVNLDMIKSALSQFKLSSEVKESDPMALFELTLNNLLSAGALDDNDFLARADTLSTLGYNVLISNYSEYYRLTAYFRRYTNEPIGMVLGINTLLNIFDEQYYTALEGGMLEALGRLFQKSVKLFVYPMRKSDYVGFAQKKKIDFDPTYLNQLPDILGAEDVHVSSNLRHLYRYLIEAKFIEQINEYNESYLSIIAQEVLAKIQSGTNQEWEKLVPPTAVAIIKQRGAFGYRRN
jgi:hypothetical protein